MILSQIPGIEAGFTTCSDFSAGIDRFERYIVYYKTLNPDLRFTMELRNFKNNYAQCMSYLDAIYSAWPQSDYFTVGANAEMFANTLVPIPA